MDEKTKRAIFAEAISTGNPDGTKTQSYQDYMTAQFAKHDGWLRECGVNFRKDPDLAGWLINARE